MSIPNHQNLSVAKEDFKKWCFTESQNGWGQQSSLEMAQSHALLAAGSAGAVCPPPFEYLQGWRFYRLSRQPVPVFSCSEGFSLFSCISVCAHCLLSCLWTTLRTVQLCLHFPHKTYKDTDKTLPLPLVFFRLISLYLTDVLIPLPYLNPFAIPTSMCPHLSSTGVPIAGHNTSFVVLPVLSGEQVSPSLACWQCSSLCIPGCSCIHCCKAVKGCDQFVITFVKLLFR